MSKRYNTPHRTHIIKTRVTEEEQPCCSNFSIGGIHMANCKNRNKSFNGALGTLGGLF